MIEIIVLVSAVIVFGAFMYSAYDVATH